MLTVATGFRILELWSEITLAAIQKATPEQVQALIDRHENRVEWLRARIDRLKDDDATP